MGAANPGAVVYARDLVRLSRFYEQLFAMRVVEEETGHVVLETPGFQLVVVAIPAAIAKDIVIAAPPIRRESTPIKLVFPVPGFEDARRLAQHLGGAVNGPEREWEFRGARICDGWDPEGNVIQLRWTAAGMSGDARELGRRFLRHGASTLYWRRTTFDAAIESLRKAGYRIHQIDCSTLQTFIDAMTAVLRFQENFGDSPWNGDLNALNDGFRQFKLDGAAGIVLAFSRFDLLLGEARWCAEGTLDILEAHSRDYLLDGQQLIGLVQSGDPQISLPPLGRRTAGWNQAEWLNQNRRLPEGHAK